MEIYFVENEEKDTEQLSNELIKQFETNVSSVEDEFLHTGHFTIDDESESFETFLVDTGAKPYYNKEKMIVPLPHFSGNNEEVFRLFKTYLEHVGYDFEIREHIKRSPNYLYFAIFDEAF